MVVIDAVMRLVPGVLGDAGSALDESFGPDGGLEYPQYTRPRVFRGMAVPDVLLSGNHPAIARWRREQSLARSRPPDPSRGCLPPRSPGPDNSTTEKEGKES